MILILRARLFMVAVCGGHKALTVRFVFRSVALSSDVAVCSRGFLLFAILFTSAPIVIMNAVQR
jgi:hypothetical protein